VSRAGAAETVIIGRVVAGLAMRTAAPQSAAARRVE